MFTTHYIKKDMKNVINNSTNIYLQYRQTCSIQAVRADLR